MSDASPLVALGPWLALAALGAFHGVNPAMGWLFAVGLGLQDGRRAAVLRALPPIALGHAASIALVAGVVLTARAVVPVDALRVAGGVAVIGVGLWKAVRGAGHPRWVGMRVGFGDLTLWSFLMSSAHGAGLMLVPVLLAPAAHAAVAHGENAHAAHAQAMAAAPVGAWAALAVHSGTMLAVSAGIALAVYELLGVDFLRRAWVNLDGVWAGALMLAGVLTVASAL